jgi:DNA-binding CsgD family transcriptional regulator
VGNSESRYLLPALMEGGFNSLKMQENSLRRMQDADVLYKRIVAMSSSFFKDDDIGEIDRFREEANLLLNGIRGTDAIIAIFDHRKFAHLLEVGGEEFWGPLPEVPKAERMTQIMSLLEKDYLSFFTDSVKWFTEVLEKIPFPQRVNIQIFHCGIRYKLLNDTPICLFSKGLPFHYNENRKFSYTFNYVQNINHLLKKDFRHYWIRISYGESSEFVHTFHSQDKLYSTKDLLSVREKEILKLVADDFDTKEIAERLFISTATVGNHRSNMIEKIGARDTTALVQLAKMSGII